MVSGLQVKDISPEEGLMPAFELSYDSAPWDATPEGEQGDNPVPFGRSGGFQANGDDIFGLEQPAAPAVNGHLDEAVLYHTAILYPY